MSLWNKQNLDVLRQQAIQRVCDAELDLLAAKAVLSEIETEIILAYLQENCDVRLRKGVCTFNVPPDGPMNVVIEKIHPYSTIRDNIAIEFRPFTKKGKPCKTTMITVFECLPYFTRKTQH